MGYWEEIVPCEGEGALAQIIPGVLQPWKCPRPGWMGLGASLVSLPWQGWDRTSFKVPPNPNHSRTPCSLHPCQSQDALPLTGFLVSGGKPVHLHHWACLVDFPPCGVWCKCWKICLENQALVVLEVLSPCSSWQNCHFHQRKRPEDYSEKEKMCGQSVGHTQKENLVGMR